jgi:hypothetical protein
LRYYRKVKSAALIKQTTSIFGLYYYPFDERLDCRANDVLELKTHFPQQTEIL